MTSTMVGGLRSIMGASRSTFVNHGRRVRGWDYRRSASTSAKVSLHIPVVKYCNVLFPCGSNNSGDYYNK